MCGKDKEVRLEILEPKGVLNDPKREGLSNTRLDTLDGKTIALMGIHVDDLHSFGSDLFFDILAEMLTEKYPTIKIVRFWSFGSPNARVNADEIAAACDGWVEGVKEAITQGRRDVGVFMERAGRPGVSICSDVLEPAKRALADLNGMPAARLVTVPATDYCVAKRDRELMMPVVAAVFDKIVSALTDPLTEEEKRSFEMQYDYSNKVFTGSSIFEVNEKFQQYCEKNALSDGLAVLPPTPEAVEWMLTGTTYPRDKVIGLMYPKKGIATVEKIAISAVMAGARPEYLPVIITIIETITAKNFNQFHIVNEILPVIFISGPIIKELGLNNKIGYLAPGHRINSTIGRAVLLCMINIGWRDMKIYSSPGGPGQPAAYANQIIVENQDESPWESWAEQNGYGPDESIVTACEETGRFGFATECMSNATFEERSANLSRLFSRKGGIFTGFGMPTDGKDVRHMVVLHPTMAHQIANAGMSKRDFIQYLYDQNVIDWDRMTPEQREALKAELEQENTTAHNKMYVLSPDDVKPGLHREPFSVPEHVLVMVAGAGSGNSFVYQTVVGSTSSHAEEVEEPRPYMNKVIRGAALTKYGR
ncbi:MAG: hypothetical protein GXX89_06905 [Clostridiales bacterium]|jgi:hypothetical protein|nr:hypothetical protein [Clostridiales bacterium]